MLLANSILQIRPAPPAHRAGRAGAQLLRAQVRRQQGRRPWRWKQMPLLSHKRRRRVGEEEVGHRAAAARQCRAGAEAAAGAEAGRQV